MMVKMYYWDESDRMTETKRFTITQDFEEHHRQIRDNGHIIMGCFVEQQAEVIVNLLNELHDENEQLKIFLKAVNEELDLANRDCDILEEENEQLKQKIKKLEAQLYKVEDGVCDICNNMYLVQQGRYFVSKCKKGHDECSKMDLDYCDDFELKDGDV